MAALNNPSPGGAPSPSPSSATASVRRARTPRNMNKLPFIRSPNNNNDERMTIMERVYKPLTSAPLNGGRNTNNSISINVSVSSGPQTCSAVNRRRAFHRDPNNMPQLPFDKHATGNGNQFDNHIHRLERRGTKTDVDGGVEHTAGANKSSNRRLNRRSMHDEMVGMGTSSNSSNSRLQPPPPRQPQHQQQVKTIPLQQPPMNNMKPQQKNNKPINVNNINNNNNNNNNNNKPSSGKADRIILVDEKDKKSFWSSARGKGIDRDLNELDKINNPSHHQRNPSNSNTSIPPIPERRRGQAVVGQPTSKQNNLNGNGNNASDNNNNNMDMSFGSNSNVSSQPSNESKTSKVSPVCVSQVHIHNLKFLSPAPAKKSSVMNNVSPRHIAKPIRQLPCVSVGGGGAITSTTIKAQPHHPPPPPPRQPGKITPPPPRSKIHDTRKNDVVNKLANNSKFDLPLSSPAGGRCSPNNGSHTITSQIIHDGIKLKASSGHVRHVSTPLDNNGVLHPPSNKAASHVRQYSAPPPPPPSNSASSSIPLPKTKLRRASSESSEMNRKEIQKNLLYPPPPKNHSVNNNKSPGGAGVGAIHSPVVTRNTNSTVPGVVGTRGSTSRPPFQDAIASTKLATNPNNTTNTDFNKSMSGTLLNEKMASMTIERMMNLPPQVMQRQLNHAQELSALTSSTTKLQHNQPQHGGSYQHPVKSVLAQHQQQQQSGQQQGGNHPQPQQEHSQDQSQRGVRQDYTLGESARSSSHMVIQPNPKAATDAVNSLNNHDFAFIRRSDGSYSYAILAYRSNTEEEKRELQQQLQGEAIGQVVSLDKNDTEEEEEEEECMTFVLSNAGCTKLIKKSQWREYVRLISNKTSSDEFMMSSHGEDTKQEEEVNHTIPPSTTPNDEASPPSNSNTNNNNATKEEEEVKSDHEVEEYLKKLRQEFYATRGPPTVGDGWIPPTTISFDIEDDDISCVSEAIVYSAGQQQQPTTSPHYTNESSIEEITENGIGATRYKPSQPRILE